MSLVIITPWHASRWATGACSIRPLQRHDDQMNSSMCIIAPLRSKIAEVLREGETGKKHGINKDEERNDDEADTNEKAEAVPILPCFLDEDHDGQ